MRSQALAISLVIASGIAIFVMSLSALGSLSRSKQAYYERFRFAHVFSSVNRAPLGLQDRLSELPGVGFAYARIVVDVTVDVPGVSEPVTGRIISLPDYGEPLLNGVYLQRGRLPDSQSRAEVIVGQAFAEAHGLNPGDRIAAILNGRLQHLNIVGVGLSPEYVIQIQPGSLLPDDHRFGVFWMPRRQLAAAFDMEGAFNDVVLTVMPGDSVDRVIDGVDQILAPYGTMGAYGRDLHTSARFLSEEIRQLVTMAWVAPAIFLFVAAFLLNVVLGRIVTLQREQIAALKALGYQGWDIGWHYAKLVLLIAVVGTVIGTAVGGYLGRGLTATYAQFYRFPHVIIEIQWELLAAAMLIASIAALLGTYNSVRRAMALPPAEAMRPPSPPRFGKSLLERFGLSQSLPYLGRMILRQLERRPAKAAMGTIGIALAVGITIMGSFSLDAINYLMHFQFRLAQRYHMSIAMVEPSDIRVLASVRSLPGVLNAEPFRVAPVRMRFGPRTQQTSLLGLRPETTLYRLLDVEEQPVAIPEDGLLLSDKLADLLAVRLGDVVTVEVMEAKRPVLQLPVMAIITEYQGTNAYINKQSLNRILGEGPVVSGAYLEIDEHYEQSLFRALKLTPRVAVVNVKTAVLQSFQDTIAENLLIMRTFNILFAVIISFGVVYNGARISLAETSRQLATLRVLGFTRGEVSAILFGELAVLTALGVPLGCLIGYGLAAMLVQGLETEMYRIPLVIERSTYAFAGLVVVIATIFSGLIVRRRIDRLDLIGVMKTIG